MKKKAPKSKPLAKAKPKQKPKAEAKAKATKAKADRAKPAPKKSVAKVLKAEPKQKAEPKKKAPRNGGGDAEFLETLLHKVREPKATAEGAEGGEDLDSEVRAALDAPATKEEEKGLEKVMASLSQIFGGKDFLSDAELDAFLDSKIASGEIPPSAALDPLDEAQSLIYEAWNSEGPHKIELARRALDLSKDCADAYVILAESDAKSKEAALGLYRKGVEAGQRAIDPGLFARSAGRFWDIMETRPYMRARLGLAECLWDLGKKEEALGHLRELMRLNPADDQGVRYILLQCLLESGADDELGALLDRYGKDTSPEIRYTHALWLFRRQGPGAAAGARLKEAIRANPHVPAYLLKRKKLSNRIPSAAREGSEEEAEAYASGAADTWHRTLGALDWLASRSAV
jgi:tetratricopeptide (TPR) repeat protein